MEEDRAIRLYVSGKITEDQLDRQRRFITERLETLRARLDEYRSQQTALAEKRILMENIVIWAEKMGDSLDDPVRRRTPQGVGASSRRGDHRPRQQRRDHAGSANRGFCLD